MAWCPKENKMVKGVYDYKCRVFADNSIVRYSEIKNKSGWSYHRSILPTFYCPDCGTECSMTPENVVAEIAKKHEV